MFYIFRFTIRLLFISSIFYSFSHAIEIKNSKSAVDIAGKQRMYTQRMLKDYAMIGMKNNFGNSTEDLKVIMSEFEEHLKSLADYSKNKEIKKSADLVKELWLPIKKNLNNTPVKEEVKALQEKLEKLLKASDTLTHLFADESGKAVGKIVDMSGRQRMLSQRMASLYMLKVWGVDDKKFKEKMDDTMKLFKESLKRLQKSEINDEKINKLLLKVEKSFMFFEIMNKSNNIFIPTLIYKKSDDILKNMDLITKYYVLVQNN